MIEKIIEIMVEEVTTSVIKVFFFLLKDENDWMDEMLKKSITTILSKIVVLIVDLIPAAVNCRWRSI